MVDRKQCPRFDLRLRSRAVPKQEWLRVRIAVAGARPARGHYSDSPRSDEPVNPLDHYSFKFSRFRLWVVTLRVRINRRGNNTCFFSYLDVLLVRHGGGKGDAEHARGLVSAIAWRSAQQDWTEP